MIAKNVSGRERTLESLVQLVAALDRRVPHPERSAEQQIALEASELRGEASLRIEQLQLAATGRSAPEPGLPGVVIGDDGGTGQTD